MTAKELEFPNSFNPDLVSMIKGLLHRNPSKRLGFKNGMLEIRNHPYCKIIDWNKIADKEIEPLYKPNHNVSNFDL